jgi:RNA polymerase sigma factor (sigma-70 family)
MTPSSTPNAASRTGESDSRHSHPAEWPDILRRNCATLRSRSSKPEHDRAREQTWLVLHGAITLRLRQAAAQFYGVGPEDIEDLAATKALDLLLRAENGSWDIDGRSGEEIQGYLRSAARNAIVDLLRARGRLLTTDDIDREVVRDTGAGRPAPVEAPELAVENREFARTLRECAEKLAPRSRRAWFFRVFYDFSAREIAEHPDMRLKPSHVDVILQRARQAIGDCMSGRGFASRDLCPGAFVELWESFAAGEALP